MIPEEILALLKDNGFILVQEEYSENFGDFYKIFDNDILLLRFISDRSRESINISSKYEDEWFDLTLVKALLFEEIKLISNISFKEYCNLLLIKLPEIIELFKHVNYLTTKSLLEQLSYERAKQMFPGKIHRR